MLRVRTGEAWLPGRLCIASEYRLLYECVFEGVASDLCSDDRTYSIGEREREHPPRQLDKSMEHSWIRHESASRYCRASHVETAVRIRNELRRNRQTGTE